MHCFVHVHRRRKPSAPGAFWTVLLMEQVAKATCILCKKLQRTRGGTWRFPRVSRAKSGILWLSGGTTRFRWRGASYLGPSMNPWPGVRGGPHPGASHQRDCCRRRPILHKCKNHTSSDKRSMEDTKRRRSNERPGVSQRHSQLRSVTGVAVSPTEDDLRGGVAPPACICATVFCLVPFDGAKSRAARA